MRFVPQGGREPLSAPASGPRPTGNRKAAAVLASVLVALSPTGCSAFRSGHQTLTVTVSEPGAEILVNGRSVGTGGTAVEEVPCDQNVSILVRKEGFRPTTRSIGTAVSRVGMLDLIGGWLILLPFIGLAFPGAWQLQEANVSIVLVPDQG